MINATQLIDEWSVEWRVKNENLGLWGGWDKK
jgi:hypothetical protein